MKHILLEINRTREWAASVVGGILQYHKSENCKWMLHYDIPPDQVFKYASSLNAAGAFVQYANREEVEQLLSAGIAVVQVCHWGDNVPAPTVRPADEQVGEMAARSLLQTGTRNLAYIGEEVAGYSRLRCSGFRRIAQQEGIDPHVLELPPRGALQVQELIPSQTGLLATWLKQLPKPAAIFAANDHIARHVAAFCALQGIKIPSEISLMGVDNDSFECMASQPNLSSIRIPFKNIGQIAAEGMATLLNRMPSPFQSKLVNPVDVVIRESTSHREFSDAIVEKALGYIEANIERPFRVRELVAFCGVSPHTLADRFQKHLGMPPVAEIRRQRIERAKALLSDTDEAVSSIATQCGFKSLFHFSKAFKELTGISPSAFRQMT
jgi:LacI family transcriptional regulator